MARRESGSPLSRHALDRTRRTPGSDPAGLVLVLLAHALAAGWGPLMSGLHPDETELVTHAWLTAHGWLPHADYRIEYFGLSPILHAGIGSLAGFEPVVFRVWVLLVGLAIGLMLWHIGRRWLPDRWALLAPVLAAAAGVRHPGLVANPSWYAVLLGLWSIGLLAGSADRRAFRLVASGCCAGVAFAFKQTQGAFNLAGLLLALLAPVATTRPDGGIEARSRGPRWQRVVLSAGIAVAFASYLASTGHLLGFAPLLLPIVLLAIKLASTPETALSGQTESLKNDPVQESDALGVTCPRRPANPGSHGPWAWRGVSSGLAMDVALLVAGFASIPCALVGALALARSPAACAQLIHDSFTDLPHLGLAGDSAIGWPWTRAATFALAACLLPWVLGRMLACRRRDRAVQAVSTTVLVTAGLATWAMLADAMPGSSARLVAISQQVTVAFVATIYSAAALAVTARSDRPPLWTPILAYGATQAAVIFPFADERYDVFALPPALLVGAILLHRAHTRWCATLSPHVRAALARLILAGAIPWGMAALLRGGIGFVAAGPSPLPGFSHPLLVDSGLSRDVAGAIDALAQVAGPGGSFIAFPDPLFHLLLNRMPPEPEVLVYECYASEVADAQIARIIGRSAVRAVVLGSSVGQVGYTGGWRRVEARVGRSFALIGRFGRYSVWHRCTRNQVP